MVIAQLIGGLGNQLFQYAAARRLAQYHQVPLKLDITGFETYKLHNYSLNHFNIVETFAQPDEIARYKKQGFIHRVRRRFFPYALQRHILEKSLSFQPAILNLHPNVYLQGYWQSERYFIDIAVIIRQEFMIKTPIDAINAQLSEQITATNAVSLHVRRGDYASNPVFQKVHGLTSLEYYAKAIQKIAAQVENTHFFIFSDDPDWTRANLNFDVPLTFVTHNQADKNYEDLRLMSLCQHHIIANSSFSWWGAWLGGNPKKIICYPAHWANDKNLNTSDIIPNGWQKIE